MKRLLLVLAIILSASPVMAGKMTVVVSVAPLKYFVEQIGGDMVDVSVMVPPGASPATYEPKPRQMARLAGARLFVAVGVPFERAWLPRMKGVNPDITIVRATAGMELLPMEIHHHGVETHHSLGHPDEDRIYDPHVWNSPNKCRELAGTILSALVQADSSSSKEFQHRYDRLLGKIHDVDNSIRLMLADSKGMHFLVYHPSWGYFAHDYGLVQVPVEMEGKEPGPRELAATIRLAKRENIKMVFVQPQFSARSAKTVAEAIGGELVVADPLSEDWENSLLNLAKAIKGTRQ